ncbi:HAMP domain-containing sensor histidine kinase [Clostridiaceae bacterium 35-E11]
MKGILSKLWLAITSLVVIILLITWIFQVALLNEFYIRERKATLEDEADKLASLFQESDSEEKLSQEVLEEINAFVSTINARVFIFDEQDHIPFYSMSDKYVSSPRDTNKTQNKTINFFLRDRDIRLKIEENKSFTMIRKRSLDHVPSIFVGVPVIREGVKVANIVISSPLAPIEETISILKKQLSFISIFSLGIGTLLALWLAKFFTKPILNITHVAKQIAKGDFVTKVTHKSKDEIGILGDTINDMAKQLDKIEQLRKELIANVSHELKTPISLIKAYAELLETIDDINKEDKHAYLEVIRDESDRLNRMIEDVLYLSKMESGFSNLIYETFSLEKLLNNVLEKLSYFASHKNVQLHVEAEDQAFLLHADKDKMYQVLFNLMNNAIEYAFENGKVMIKIFNIDNVLRMEVIDEGKGISEEELPYVWERFYKVDKSGKRNDSGTGLGMAIVKNILEAHQFQYGITSQLNEGTTVWIEMPLNDE